MASIKNMRSNDNLIKAEIIKERVEKRIGKEVEDETEENRDGKRWKRFLKNRQQQKCASKTLISWVVAEGGGGGGVKIKGPEIPYKKNDYNWELK